MAQATLTVTLPDRVWIQQVSVAHPETTFTVLAAIPGQDSGFALVTITGPNVSAVLESMGAHTQLASLSVVEQTNGEATVHLESTRPLLLGSSRESGMPIEHPVEIVDGQATLEVTGTRDRLSDLVTQLEQFGLHYRVESVRDEFLTSQLLSERQRELLFAAVEQGYYDTPRKCTLTELADEQGIAKSTASETLHRAEEVVIKEFVRNLPSETLEPARPT